jgi:hypothetical protein
MTVCSSGWNNVQLEIIKRLRMKIIFFIFLPHKIIYINNKN